MKKNTILFITRKWFFWKKYVKEEDDDVDEEEEDNEEVMIFLLFSMSNSPERQIGMSKHTQNRPLKKNHS